MQRWRKYSRALMSLGIIVGFCHFAFALDPSLDVSQYAHTAWKVREGFGRGEIISIAQTPDGYLWLGTDFGLLRFDGVRNIPWQPPAGQQLPSSRILSLLAGRDGTFWIGTMKGLASWKGGKLTQFPELEGQAIFSLLEDREGTVWVGGMAYPPPGKLCAIHDSSVRCSGANGSFGMGVDNLYEDRKGTLWAATPTALWRWKPGPAQFYSLPSEANQAVDLGEDQDGTILITMRKGLGRLVNGKIEAYPLPVPGRPSYVRLFRDRDGGLWIGTSTQGVLHFYQGRVDGFELADGLSGAGVNALFEDREGDVWVGTVSGLDRFRAFAIPTFTVKQGLTNNQTETVIAARGGRIWVTTYSGMNRSDHGRFTPFGISIAKGGGLQGTSGTAKPDGKINGLNPDNLFQDRDGQIWVATLRGFGYLQNDRFIPAQGAPPGFVHAIAQDATGDLWFANQDSGLLRVRQGSVVQQIPWAGLDKGKRAAVCLAADPRGRGLWVGFYQGGVDYLVDGAVRASYTSADGLGEGNVTGLRFDGDGTLWAATAGGLSRLKNGHVATLTSKNGLPCDTVQWAREDNDHGLWMDMPCGLIRVARADIDAWASAVDHHQDTSRAIPIAVFDSSDGVLTAIASNLSSQVARSPDGKIWFSPLDGISVIDPRHLATNKLPPPVHVEQITADRKTYWQNLFGDATSQVRLPPRVRDLEIDYTALSFVAPEKVRFRYRLEGRDRDWEDAGTRRQAYYTDLAPGNYHFHVAACNNSGVWNEAGDTLDFYITPAYYQTLWFRFVCAAALLALIWALYQYRLHQIELEFGLRLDERVGERTRIARELHDTLLQSFHGLMFRIQAARNLLPRRPEDAMQALDGVLTRAEEAIAESRNAIHDLRAEASAQNDLAHLLTAVGPELAGSGAAQAGAPNFSVTVEGERQAVSPVLQDEVYRIACEVLRNAFRHAGARQIEAEIHYDARLLRVRIRDDGRGLDPQVLKEGGRAGHWGLPGIRDRAKRIGAQLDFWSEAGAGTEVQLTVPGSIAYAASSGRRRWWFGGGGKA